MEEQLNTIQDPTNLAQNPPLPIRTISSTGGSGTGYNSSVQYFFFFVNPKSGGQTGKKLLDLGSEFTFKDLTKGITFYADISSIQIETVSLLDPKNLNEQLNKLKRLSHLNNTAHPIIAVAGGGDGTVCWVIDLISSLGCNIDKVAVSHFPLGTGNDYANAMGFGPSVGYYNFLKHGVKGLENFISECLKCEIEPVDVWEFQLGMTKDGYYQIIASNENGRRKKRSVTDFDFPSTQRRELRRYYKRKFTNYASIGLMARIGLGFDKKRTSSRMMNKVMYAYESFKKFISCQKHIKGVIEKVEIVVKEKKFENENDENKLRTFSPKKQMQQLGSAEKKFEEIDPSEEDFEVYVGESFGEKSQEQILNQEEMKLNVEKENSIDNEFDLKEEQGREIPLIEEDDSNARIDSPFVKFQKRIEHNNYLEVKEKDKKLEEDSFQQIKDLENSLIDQEFGSRRVLARTVFSTLQKKQKDESNI